MIYLLAMLLLPVVVGFGPSPPLQPAGTLVHKLKVAGWTDASPTLSPDVRNLFLSLIVGWFNSSAFASTMHSVRQHGCICSFAFPPPRRRHPFQNRRVALQGSKAYVGAGNTLLAVDTMSQTILWTFTSCRPITSKAIVSTDGQSIYAYLCWDVDDKSSFYNGA